MVAQLVEALRSNLQGSGFDSWWCHWNLLNPSGRTMVLWYTQPHTEYFLSGKAGRCLELTTLPPSRTDCLEIWEPQPSGILRACPDLYRDRLLSTRILRPGLSWLITGSKGGLCHCGDEVSCSVTMYGLTISVMKWSITVAPNKVQELGA